MIAIIIEKIKSYIQSRIGDFVKKYKEKKDAGLIQIALKALKETVSKEYKGYTFDCNFKSRKIIQKVLIEIKVKSLLDLNNAVCKGTFLECIKKNKIINVIDKRLSNNQEDVNKFYIMFQDNLRKEIESRIVENERAYKQITIQADEETLTRIDKIKDNQNKNTNSINEQIKQSKKEIIDTIKGNNASNDCNVTDIFINNVPKKTFEGITLQLDKYFNGRRLIEGKEWSDIREEMDNFIDELDKRQKYAINLSCCYSVGYYAGMKFNSKYGWSNIVLKQNSARISGIEVWNNEKLFSDEKYIKFKSIETTPYDKSGKLGVFISISNKIDKLDEIKLKHNLDDYVHFYIEDDKENNNIIVDGYHAAMLVDVIKKYINKCEYGSLHIFASAPIGFMYKLGERSFGFKNINIYEYIPSEKDYFKLGEISSTDTINN